MKKKNQKALKVFLVGVSVVLVTAISVGLTLAYLTTQTDPIKNDFTAKGDIAGRIAEPNWTAANALKIAPGKTLDKNPIVDNETGDTYIWVGVRVEFVLDVDGTPKTVPYSTFSKYVELTGLTGTDWVEYTAADDGLVNATYKYYFYTKVLDKDKDDTGDAKVENADSTTELFTKVTPKKEIVIDPDAATGTYVVNTSIPASPDFSELIFKKFDFQINIKGYGVKAYKTSSTEDGAVTQASAKAEILDKLGGKTA